LQPTGSERDELLDRVYGRARQLWWQRRVAPVVAASLVLLGLVTAPVLLRDGGRAPRKVAAIDQPTTTVEDTTTTTTAEEAAPTTVLDAPTSVPRTTVPRTTTSLVCRNSRDPRCGPFRWDPDVGTNEPISVEATFSPSSPKVGDTVTFTVNSVDPDAAPIITHGCGTATAFGDADRSYCSASCLAPDRFGPWSPPPRQRGTQTEVLTHVYAAAGTFQAQFDRISIGQCSDNPYASEGGSATVTVTVTE
jgi:hypothetical protein